MFFLVTLVFLVLFYVLPLHQVIYTWAPSWSLTPGFLRRAYALSGINLPFWLFMVAAFIALYAVGKLVASLLETWEPGSRRQIADAVNPIVELKGLWRVQAIALVLIPLLLAFAFVMGRMSQLVLLLGLLSFVALLVNGVGRVPLPVPPPLSSVPMVGVTPERPSAPAIVEGDIQRRYTWRFAPRPYLPGIPATDFSLDLNINEARYKRSHEEPRELDPLRWDKYVVEPSPEVQLLAAALGDLHLRREYCTFNQAANTLAFVQQCVKYAPDLSPEGEPTECPKYPIESLVEQAGDCEDHAILAAALLKRMGIDVALLMCPGHVALGVAGAEGLPGIYVEDAHSGVKYFYGETTADGWRLGDVPQDLAKYVSGGEFQAVPIVLTIEAPS